MNLYTYAARVIKVVDGDTVDLEVDVGFGIRFRERFRLMGINTPEIHGVKKESEEWKAGMIAKEWLADHTEGLDLTIETVKDKKGKYGRYLVYIFKEDGTTFNMEMVKLGMAEEREY